MFFNKSLKTVAAIGIFLLLAIFIPLSASVVSAQNEYATDLAERLIDSGVPVKYVDRISLFPYSVEIALESSSRGHQLAIQDNWNMQLARREAIFAYRIGARIHNLRLIIFNTSNQVIHSEEIYLYPDDLNQQLNVSERSMKSNQETKDIVNSKIQLAGLTLDKLNIIDEKGDGSYGQILIINISATDFDEAIKSFPTFYWSLTETLDTINDEYGTNIVICHLILVDNNGKILLDYVKDFEAGVTQWTNVTGLYQGWSYSDPYGSDNLSPSSTSRSRV